MSRYFSFISLSLMLCLGTAHADAPPSVSAITAADAALSAPGPEAAAQTIVATPGQPFAQALHIETRGASANPWDIQVILPTNTPIKAGDALLLTFYARVLSPGDGSAMINAGFEKASDPYTKSLEVNLTPSGVWTRFDLPFKSLDDYPSGQAHAHFLLGFGRLTVEMGGFSLRDYGPTVSPMSLPRFRVDYPGRAANAPWRSAAQARIRRYRMEDITVCVVDAAGKPIVGAAVHIVQTRQAFPFGTAVSYQNLLPPGAANDLYRRKVLDIFTEASPENELKSGDWFGTDLKKRQSGLDMVEWLREHKIAVRGHNLVWPSWNMSPGAMKTEFATRQAAEGSDAARAWLAASLTTHITDEVGTLKGRVPEWDVINEPVANHDFMDILGDDAMVTWFKTAHAADPKARLFINNDGTFYGQANPADIAAFQRILRHLFGHGAPLGGIGLESHFSSALSSPAQVLKSLDEYAKFGVPLEITEFDFKTPDAELQADYTRDFLTLAFSHPAVTGFQMWGFWDGAHWLGNAPLYAKDWAPKSAGLAFLDLVQRQWHTDVQGKTDAAGNFSVRGFLGDYTVGVMSGGKSQARPFTLETTLRPVKITLP